MEPTWGYSISGCARNAPTSSFVRNPVIVVWHCFMIGFKAYVEINSKLTSKALPFYLNWNTNVDASAAFCLPSLDAVTQVKRSSCWVCVLLASDTPNNTWYWSILSWDRSLSFWWMHGRFLIGFVTYSPGWLPYPSSQNILCPPIVCLTCFVFQPAGSELPGRGLSLTQGRLEETCDPSQVSGCLHRKIKSCECMMAFSLETHCSS